MRFEGLDKLKGAPNPLKRAWESLPKGKSPKLVGQTAELVRQWGPKKFLGHSGPPIGIDFGTSALKVLQIAEPAEGGDAPALVAAAMIETPEELRKDAASRLRFQFEKLPKLIEDGGFKGKRAAAAIPAAQTVCKPLRLQVPEGVALGSLVAGTLPGQLGCDVSQLLYRYVNAGQVGGDGAAKTEVVCIAAARDFVERIIRAMRAANLDPVGMHNEFRATMHAFGPVGGQSMEDAGSATLYLDIGAGSTKITITHGRSMAFAKTIEIGGRHLDEAVAQQRGLKTPAEARAQRLSMKSFQVPEGAAAPSAPETEGMALLAAAMRRGDGERPSGPAVAVASEADLSEPLEMLTDEVSMCLRYHHAAFPDERLESIVFMGGESRHLALCQHISRVLKLSAQVGDPLANVLRAGDEPVSGVVLDGPQPGWTVALGLCLAPTDL